MSSLKSICVFVPFFLIGIFSFAQMPNDATTWKYEVKKKSATEYQLIFHLKLDKGWFIWALKPGGDGTLVAPAFTFDKNEKIKMKGSVIEKGKKTEKKLDGISGVSAYYTGTVDYVQDITVTGKTKITGKHEYQVCNYRYAIPPIYKDFVFEIK